MNRLFRSLIFLLMVVPLLADTGTKLYYVANNGNSYGRWSGLCLSGVAGDSLHFGQVAYLNSNGKFYRYTSDTTLGSVVSLSPMSNNQTGLFLYSGT